MTNTVISYPIPAYSNVPIQPLYYAPSRFVINAITTGVTTLVSTSIAHNYVIGQLVRLIIPIGYGSRQLNGQSGYVISIPSTTSFVLDLNSQNNDAFIASPSISTTGNAQCLAIGDANNGSINTTNSNLFYNIPGAFIDISPFTNLSASPFSD